MLRMGLARPDLALLLQQQGSNALPVALLQLLEVRKRGVRRMFDIARPFIGLGDDVEHRRGRRGVDAPKLDLQPVKLELVAGDRIEPVERSAMLLLEPFGDPDDGRGLQACRIGQKLTEMAMIGLFKLVLDQHPMFVGSVGSLGDDISLEGADELLGRLDLKVHFQRVLKQFQPLGRG